MKKKDFLNLFFLTILVLGIIFCSIYPNKLFGSVTDWGSQHTMFPEYFRTLFYHTGDIFPDFMMNLGAGQNIYNISYYGLLNPIVLLSFLFPFIKMVDFLTIASILEILCSVYLCYYWLSKKGFSHSITFITTLIFTCATPLIFHAHRHIMFINYMPFLILGLIGVDKYFEKNKRSLITFGVLGMILTSYYYSIGGILVLVLYGIYIYLMMEEHVTLKKFLLDGIKFLYPILLGIGLSAILLIPTAYVIFNGRSGGKEPIALTKLLIPHFDINALVYSSYSIGLSAIAVFALFHTFFTKKKANIFLGFSLFIVLSIPFIMYALNGMLYVRAKVLIPFLPLFVLLIGFLLRDLEQKKSNVKLEILTLTLFAFFWSWRGYHQNWFFIDLGFCFLFLYAYYRWQRKFLYMIPIGFLSIAMVIVANHGEKYELRDNYNRAFNREKMDTIKNVIEKDKDFYRFNDLTDTLLTSNKVYHPHYYSTSLYSSTFHQPYKDFFYNEMGNADTYRNRLVTSSSNNIFFQTLMNVKYVFAKVGEQPVGYELVEQNGEYGVYKNDNVYPFGYVTTNIYQKSFYDTLKYPYNMELLMNGAVVENQGENSFSSDIKKYEIEYPSAIDGLEVIKTERGYTVTAKKNVTFSIPLKERIKENQILMLRFRVDKSQNCKKGDLSIAINQISNKLTCKQWMYHNGNYDFEYAISGTETNYLSVYISKGTFEIVDIESYILDYQTFQNSPKLVDSMVIDIENTKGDKIYGTIDVSESGHFVLSIPYDEAFKIKVDGKKQEFSKVNDVFIGFPLEKGNHKIEIIYKAPWKKVGAVVSIFSLLLLGIMIYSDKKQK
ncbi:MAG: YfhO family protein [Bacilli bacterium]|nr:YfhO family protein [Bacilli bacterium]